MFRKLFVLLAGLALSLAIANDYAPFQNSKFSYPIEKSFATNLKPANPDDIRSGGYVKFGATILYDDKSLAKELESKIDIIRSIFLDSISGFYGVDLQQSSGRAKLAGVITASVNAILTEGKINTVAFSEFVMQLPPPQSF